MNDESPIFGHEKLKVYQRSISFVKFVQAITSELPKRSYIIDQITRASSSIPLNIAEGNGKYTSKDKSKYFDIARGSALECAACLDLLAIQFQMTSEDINKGKEMLKEIVSMLIGLTKSISKRVHEPVSDYENEVEDKDQD